MFRTSRSVYTPNDFLAWHDAGGLELSPKFQRRPVWKTAARSYFIDTMLRGMPVPPIYLRVVQSAGSRSIMREVVDGQQRLSAVLEFLNGDLRLASSVSPEWGGKTFSRLSTELQLQIQRFEMNTEVFQGISDEEVLEVFARLNTYSIKLNSQELRNGKYFGQFKQSAYALAYEHLTFWRRHRVFTEQSIARMLEVELTSELLVAQLEGMQDKKKSIDKFYKRYDESFKERDIQEQRFRRTIDEVVNITSDNLESLEFSRPPLFYTLFCVVYHRLFGLPGIRGRSPGKGFTAATRERLFSTLRHLSDEVSISRRNADYSSTEQSFVSACLRQTDNITPRQVRFEVIYGQAF